MRELDARLCRLRQRPLDLDGSREGVGGRCEDREERVPAGRDLIPAMTPEGQADDRPVKLEGAGERLGSKLGREGACCPRRR